MNSNSLSRTGTIVYALMIAFFGINHFLHADMMAAAVPGFMPGGKLWVYITGLALVAAALAFLFAVQVKVAGILLAVMLIIFVLTIHIPGFMHSEGQSKTMFFTNMLKDTALAGASLHIAGRGR